MFKVPEQCRYTKTVYSDASFGNNGHFLLDFEAGNKSRELFCCVSDGDMWEHVSVSIMSLAKIPTWEHMCFAKSAFWDREDVVVQFHPKESEYSNCNPFVLHLWRHKATEFIRPPTKLVGAPSFSDTPKFKKKLKD